jgi:hypothetical protein
VVHPFDSPAKPKAAGRDEIAKQICAFSNAGGGFLVFGISKEKQIDGGVPMVVGRQSTKDWIEGIIPTLHCGGVLQRALALAGARWDPAAPLARRWCCQLGGCHALTLCLKA